MNKLIYNSVICLSCGETLISRHRHDYKTCSCENETMVDMANNAGESATVGRIDSASSIVGEGTMDYVMASFWDYWEPDANKPSSFRELKKVLRPGGKVVFNVHKPHFSITKDFAKKLDPFMKMAFGII